MSLIYFQGDERPAWVPTVTVNGVADNMTAGYTFEVKVYADSATPLLTKTTNITGGAGGTVTVTWAANELNIAPGAYVAQCKASRTSDSAEWTITEPLQILARA